ncbi:TBCC domain-containing protein 1-like isoform X1 [Branchiostoma lanceolatum]|uniref:TBCC domain-containing protein 1-like isoform X1 n=1 Tax=Branchiostoma lanceolatum TaxID=7740 RepID=UPI0034558433
MHHGGGKQAGGSETLQLWVRPEPFTLGVLPLPPHPKLGLHYLKKISVYAKTKGKQGFPRLSYAVWKHVACNKLQLSEDLAWVYFETYDLLSHPSGEDRSEQEGGSPGRKSVETFKFLLFLYIQQSNKISLRDSSLVTGEEWPTRSRSPSPDPDGRTSHGPKGLDEQNHLLFVINHLDEMMGLLVEPDQYGDGVHDQLLSVEAVQALGFVIEGSSNGKQVKPVHTIAMQHGVQQQSGYSKISQSFSFRSLQTWVRKHLGANLFGITACIATGRRLSWTKPVEQDGRTESSPGKRGRVATNAHIASKQNKVLILSQVCKQTVSQSSEVVSEAHIKIHRCHFSFIYLLSPLRSVSIEKCKHTTVVLGPVATFINVVGCEHTTIIAVCRRISVSSSTLCTFHTLTPSQPLVFGGNDSLTFGPYHTHYPQLENHMTQVGLGTESNFWDQPLALGKVALGKVKLGPDSQEVPVFEIMNPKDFYVFVTPFDMEGDTKEIPGGLPEEYERALHHRERDVKRWQRTVKEAGLSKEQKKQFQSIVEAKFQAWLAETGNKRQLDGLVPSSPTHRAAMDSPR